MVRLTQQPKIWLTSTAALTAVPGNGRPEAVGPGDFKGVKLATVCRFGRPLVRCGGHGRERRGSEGRQMSAELTGGVPVPHREHRAELTAAGPGGSSPTDSQAAGRILQRKIARGDRSSQLWQASSIGTHLMRSSFTARCHLGLASERKESGALLGPAHRGAVCMALGHPTAADSLITVKAEKTPGRIGASPQALSRQQGVSPRCATPPMQTRSSALTAAGAPAPPLRQQSRTKTRLCA
ncbi:hypothetical protein AAFF_G00258710 [Aldrovandia affinis]|uniref:Uncharacterized protein n=1 Tax=Aldrovandia affinis TaxID=143900 RepID=A0AAD7SUJ3_9TELE|nr:hypothetical protein AAFF_G00258710 [Aldrovandia affinis]